MSTATITVTSTTATPETPLSASPPSSVTSQSNMSTRYHSFPTDIGTILTIPLFILLNLAIVGVLASFLAVALSFALQIVTLGSVVLAIVLPIADAFEDKEISGMGGSTDYEKRVKDVDMNDWECVNERVDSVHGDDEVTVIEKAVGNGEVAGDGEVVEGDGVAENNEVAENDKIAGNGDVLGNAEVVESGKVVENGEVTGNGEVVGNGKVVGDGEVVENSEVVGNGEVEGNGNKTQPPEEEK